MTTLASDRVDAGSRTVGLAPIAAPQVHTLILGSLPSRASVAAGQYYAHPRNAFWPIMGRLFGAGPELDYAQRAERLLQSGIGLWDVLRSSVRPGSLDAAIDLATAIPNDFNNFLKEYRNIRRICFNGRTAESLFARRVTLDPGVTQRSLAYLGLPSTSPAHAAMPFGDKLSRWADVRRPD